MYEKAIIDFLGYRISLNKTEPLTRRSKSITNYVKPNTKKKLMGFLGLVNYDRSFIPKLSSKLKPLYEMLKEKNNKLKWSIVNDKIFDEIKKIWASEYECFMPNNVDKFVLETDAFLFGIGAVLKKKSFCCIYFKSFKGFLAQLYNYRT
ncbi:Transposon Ty3-G Gag-Pol polyprotein [Dictyocoela muelleri]|nr:Transposon Ty3-G Gag-Pol polyprotein [Dictyocoela muelleri]